MFYNNMNSQQYAMLYDYMFSVYIYAFSQEVFQGCSF